MRSVHSLCEDFLRAAASVLVFSFKSLMSPQRVSRVEEEWGNSAFAIVEIRHCGRFLLWLFLSVCVCVRNFSLLFFCKIRAQSESYF